MEQAKSEALLRQSAFFRGFPEHLIERITPCVSVREVPAGTLLFREGAINHELFIVVRGLIGLEMYIPGRGKTRVLSLGPGDLVAWSAVVADRRMTTTAVALEDSQLLAMPGPSLIEMCERDPELGYHFMRRVAEAISRRLVATRLQLLDLFSETAPPAFS